METHRAIDGTIKAPSPAIAMARPKRRWRQFSLWALLMLMTVLCVLLAVWIAPLWREGQVISQIRALGGQVETVAIQPDWLARLLSESLSQHAIRVKLVGDKFDDALFGRLQDLPRLEGVRLERTNVTLQAVEQLVDAKPEVLCNLAFAEYLYAESEMEYRMGQLSFDFLLRRFQWAAEWKLACSQFKDSPHDAQIRAEQQIVRWLEREIEIARILTANRAIGPTQADQDLAVCALALAEVRLAQVTSDQIKEAAACRRGLDAVSAMCEGAWARYSLQRDALQPLLHAFRLKDELQSAQFNLDHDKEAKQAALTALVDEYGRLRDLIAALRDAGLRGGEENKYVLVSALHCVVAARFAELKGDSAAQQNSLRECTDFSKRLHEANLQAYQIGVLTHDDWLSGEQLGLECELALARASDDSAAAQRAKLEYRASLVRHWQKTHALWAAGMRGGEESALALIACLLATAEIDASGENCFDKTQADIEADWEQPVVSSAD